MTSALPGDGETDVLVTVGNFLDPIAAEFARSRLEAEGLAVYIQGIGFGSLLPTSTVYPIRLQVSAADADRAAEILAEVPPTGIFPDEEEADSGDPEGGASAP